VRGIEFFFKVKVKTRIGVLILGFIMFIQYGDFTLRQQKLDSCFHRLFGNWALPLTLNISVNSSSISIINVSFGILMTSRLQICP